jgi:hypothetical protein
MRTGVERPRVSFSSRSRVSWDNAIAAATRISMSPHLMR